MHRRSTPRKWMVCILLAAMLAVSAAPSAFGAAFYNHSSEFTIRFTYLSLGCRWFMASICGTDITLKPGESWSSESRAGGFVIWDNSPAVIDRNGNGYYTKFQECLLIPQWGWVEMRANGTTFSAQSKDEHGAPVLNAGGRVAPECTFSQIINIAAI